MSSRPQLMIMTGALAGKRYDIPAGGLRLGRSSSNDIHIPDEELSRNHCLFEQDGEVGIRVIDLASANGTFVNSEQLGADARSLHLGDIIEAGTTAFKVVDEDTPAQMTEIPKAITPVPIIAGEGVDLGLGGVKGSDLISGAPEGVAPKRANLASILWGVVALSVVSAILIVLMFPAVEETSAPASVSVGEKSAEVEEVYYEKVEADGARIFRYYMTIDADGVLRVVYDDVPGENRHVDKSAKLSERAKARIAEIFSQKDWNELDEAYSGSSAAEDNSLRSWRIRAIGGGRIRETLVENTQEPDAFKQVREALETFSRNELGIWALQYSKEKLLELGAESERIGDAKWSEMDIEYGNLAAALTAYREAVFYLETVNPKPQGYSALKEKLEKATAELDRRYRDQRFLADKAINLGDWEAAQRELRVLLDMVPDKEDDRHNEANAKLVDVENRLKKSKKKGGKK